VEKWKERAASINAGPHVKMQRSLYAQLNAKDGRPLILAINDGYFAPWQEYLSLELTNPLGLKQELWIDLMDFDYRLALGAAVRRDLDAALAYAQIACLLDGANEDAAKLLDICRYEAEATDVDLEQVRLLAGQKQWLKAAEAAQDSQHQNACTLGIQGCLFALARRDAQAADCFAAALEMDSGNTLAAAALVELGRRRKPFWRFW
jgi:hypothetical protein